MSDNTANLHLGESQFIGDMCTVHPKKKRKHRGPAQPLRPGANSTRFVKNGKTHDRLVSHTLPVYESPVPDSMAWKGDIFWDSWDHLYVYAFLPLVHSIIE